MIQIKKIKYIDAEGNKKSKEIVVKDKKKSNAKNEWLLRNMNIGYYLAIPLVTSVFLGSWLDTKYKTKPVFTLVLITIGLIAAFYNLYKIIKND